MSKNTLAFIAFLSIMPLSKSDRVLLSQDELGKEILRPSDERSVESLGVEHLRHKNRIEYPLSVVPSSACTHTLDQKHTAYFVCFYYGKF